MKSASDRTSLRYDFSSPSIATSNTTVFVLPTNDGKNELASVNIEKGKFILGAPPKLDKKEIKNPRAKKGKLESPNKKSSISIITVEQLIILDLTAVSG